MSTIYTVNGKVLKNSDTDKWLTKKEVPQFVMDASNATIDGANAIWESPTYPEAFDGDGKTLEVTISSNTEMGMYNGMPMCYVGTTGTGGPPATTITLPLTAGVHTFALSANPSTSYGFGVKLALSFHTAELLQANIGKFSMRIID